MATLHETLHGRTGATGRDNARYRRAIQMRDNGATLREIGAALGVSRSRAHQMTGWHNRERTKRIDACLHGPASARGRLRKVMRCPSNPAPISPIGYVGGGAECQKNTGLDPS